MIRKISLVFTVFTLALTFLLTVALSSCSLKNSVDEARDYYERSDYEAARTALMEAEKAPETLYWLGMINLKTGHSREAMENFRVATATDALDNGKLNPSIDYISVTELMEIEKVLFRVSASNEVFKQDFLKALQDKARAFAYKGDSRNGMHLYQMAIDLDASARDDAYLTFTTIAERSLGAYEKVNSYTRALQFKPEKKQEIAVLLVNLAVDLWPSSNAKIYKNFASKFLPRTIMEEAFPGEKTKVTTLGPFTKENLNEKGYVTVLKSGKDKVKKGDKLEVVATMIDGAPYLGKDVKVAIGGKWIPLKKGRNHCWVDKVDCGFYVQIKEKKNVKFIVNIVRKYIPKPQKISFSSL